MDSYVHFKIKYIICVQKQLVNKSITLRGKARVAAFKLVNTKSFAFPRLKVLKIYKNKYKLHFAWLRCQTARFEELLSQQKIWVNVKYIRKKDDAIGRHSLTRQDRQH